MKTAIFRISNRPILKIIQILAILVQTMALVSCADLERENELDPKAVNYNGGVGGSSSSDKGGIKLPQLSSSGADGDNSSSSSDVGGSSSDAEPSSSSAEEKLSSSSGETPSSSSVEPSSSSIAPSGGSEYDPATEFCYNNSIVVSSSSSAVPSSSSINAGGGGKGTLTDSRDGKEYNTVEIGTQTWMAENLNYNATGSKCYSNSESNCGIYGRLYNWSTAMGGSASSTANPSGVRGVCPEGWHLPSQAEWNTLSSYVQSASGCTSCDARHLKATSGWSSYSGITNLDTYGFAALPGGNGYSDGGFDDAGDDGRWWSASEFNANDAFYRDMGSSASTPAGSSTIRRTCSVFVASRTKRPSDSEAIARRRQPQASGASLMPHAFMYVIMPGRGRRFFLPHCPLSEPE